MALYVPPQNEVVLALPSPITPVSRVRSTFILGSIDTLKAAGQYDDYLGRLPGEARDVILALVPGTWVSVELAATHYGVCDSLGVTAEDAARRGRLALERLGGTVLGTAVRMAKQAGATPWTVLPALQRFWSRAYEGGGVAAYKLGPKDARVDLIACGLCQIPYYRHALGGLLHGLMGLFAGTLYFREARQPGGSDRATYRAQWT